jgi:serine/threonine protein phosphatase PrpC
LHYVDCLLTLTRNISRGGEAVKLTVDHNANDEKEAQFVRDAGGFVNNGRVNGTQRCNA